VALLALVLVTAVWGVTFVRVKDAIAVCPLFAFLAVRASARLDRRPGAADRHGRALIQVWAQRRLSAACIAIVFALETVYAGLFGYVLDGDRLVGSAGAAAR
jgi:drug/metabolite transporter (DMT)-like permease